MLKSALHRWRAWPGAWTLAVATVASGSAQAQAQRYRLDPSHTFATFEVMHFGTSTMRGRVGPISGEVVMDAAAGSGELGITLPMGSISTGAAVFDARLRQADLLATAEHPAAYFVARQFRFEGAFLREVRGEFTLRGISQPLSLKALRFACRAPQAGEPNPDQAVEVCGGDFEAEVLRSDFGMDFGLPFIANRARLLVQVEARR